MRRGSPSSAPHQLPSSRCLAAAAAASGLGSLPAHQRSYAARRNLAAAAVGGRKLTHPGKAILAGGLINTVAADSSFVLPFCTALANLNLSPIKAIHAELGH